MTKSDYRPVRIAYIGGGSLNWAPGLMADLAADDRLAAEVRLFDLDVEAARRNAAMGARFADVSKGRPASYTVAETLGQALEGADIVVVSILPGGFGDMGQDIGIPARYGIPQAVGDTVGPGGFVRAMRAVPMLAEIGTAIAEHAPKAYVCNLTNPMSVLTGALHAAFPGIRAWGECHEVTKLRKQVAWIANRAAGENVASHRNVSVNVLGINHFTFVDRIALDGKDMMPAYRAFVEEFRETGWAATPSDPADEHARYFEDRSRVKFDLTRRFGIAAAAGDRHLVEFLPAGLYLHDPEAWDFALTPVEYRVRDRAAKAAKADALASGSAEPFARRSDEALIDQIAALMGDEAHLSNVNLPNTGQVENLPLGAVVETNAIFSELGVQAVQAGRLPDELATITAAHATRQTDLLHAILAGDRAALFPLFHADPLVADLDRDRARTMFDEMVAATATWLPETLKGAA
ncbi:alpha-galactosidase [Salipiger sp. IMCC34102]|uniref:family 4 glycosyl hydrolase n=1 Tax=Salipiger sp. IMCC34102 TaxID=2510647 RepID=UPI00101C388A|nr:alpha-galactosidase [Salipiger sp. IMCC34102]RYH03507.1 alpha-galactosidase [Salipiger sp. IMCC34102]